MFDFLFKTPAIAEKTSAEKFISLKIEVDVWDERVLPAGVKQTYTAMLMVGNPDTRTSQSYSFDFPIEGLEKMKDAWKEILTKDKIPELESAITTTAAAVKP